MRKSKIMLTAVFAISALLSPALVRSQELPPTEICVGDPIPHDYVIIGVMSLTSCAGRGTGHNALKLANSAGKDRMEVCADSPIPGGFMVIGAGRTAGCAATDPHLSNYKIINKPKPGVSTARICANSPLPAGWELRGDSDPVATCVIDVSYSVPNNNLLYVRRTTPPAPAPTFPLENTLLAEFRSQVRGPASPQKTVLFEELFGSSLTSASKLPYFGSFFLLSGSSAVTSTDMYANPSFFPSVSADYDRNLLYLHPGSPQIGNDVSFGYRAKAKGKYRIRGAFARGNNYTNVGDGVVVGIYRNQDPQPLFQAAIGSGHQLDTDYPFCGTGVAPFDLSPQLEKGEIIRFVVAGGQEASYDITALTAKVDAPKNGKGALYGDASVSIGQSSCS
jgi:hypothetical protein